MPRRGYRKGQSDNRLPVGHRIYVRLPASIHAHLTADANARSTVASKILREIITAHYARRPAELPQSRGVHAAVVRELRRLGNNLNQIAHHANLMNFYPLFNDARACIGLINTTVRQLSRR